jgi:hypothetical protein
VIAFARELFFLILCCGFNTHVNIDIHICKTNSIISDSIIPDSAPSYVICDRLLSRRLCHCISTVPNVEPCGVVCVSEPKALPFHFKFHNVEPLQR